VILNEQHLDIGDVLLHITYLIACGYCTFIYGQINDHDDIQT